MTKMTRKMTGHCQGFKTCVLNSARRKTPGTRRKKVLQSRLKNLKGSLHIMKKVISIVLAIMTLVGLMIPVFASAAPAVNTALYVHCPDGKSLNVRDNPNGAVVYRIASNTKVTVKTDVVCPAGWVYITAGQKSGYAMTKFLSTRKPTKYDFTENANNFISVTPYTVRSLALKGHPEKSVGLRVSPNKSSQAIRRLAAGEELEVVAVGRLWSKVVDKVTGRTGYVANDYMVRQ